MNSVFTKLKSKSAFFLVLFLFFSASLQAQLEIATAKQYLTDNAAKNKLSSSDIDEMVVSSAYLSPTTGWYHIYFNQTYQSIEVYNAMLNVTLKDGQVEYVTNNFAKNISNAVATADLKSLGANFVGLSPTQAIEKAVAKLNLNVGKLRERNTLKTAAGLINKASFSDNTLSDNNIEVKLYWLPYTSQEGEKTKSKLTLTWNVKFLTKDQQNAWSFHVDAISGEILQQNDDVIHCNFGTSEHLKTPHICPENKFLANVGNNLTTLAANTYRVFDYPVESPKHGARTAVVSPYTKFLPSSKGPGATNGWHNDGATDYTTTRGNNVWAQEDVNNNDGTGASPTSATLEFDYAYTQGLSTATGNQNAAITNLFYWNNVMHDVLWRYGFDEPSGNFQNNNQGRGGVGNDYVFADAQDGGGTNNANFYPPVDGINGRMQMYLWSNAGSPSYQPDGDFDNGVIAHEYGHGWSTRLTGGPANSNCLGNAEQGGEGWSDYAALMFTTNWASLTPTVASANIPRGIGTYVLGQTTTGAGIRPYRYSYDMTNVNGAVTYARVGDATNFSQPHGIGSIWATMLWDMTWEIILQDNQIVNNIYDTPANVADMKGNIAALKLVNEGLRLQPCSPSFIDARDAIFKADQLLFGGRYRCAIGRAFARRGLGANASTGTSSNDRTVTEDYTLFNGNGVSSALSLNVCSGTPLNYTVTSLITGTSFSWTRPAVAGISNPAASGTSATIGEALINTTDAPIVVKYYFTLSPDPCSSTPLVQPITVTVNPTLIPTIGNYALCQNATVPNGQGLVVPSVLSNITSGALVAGTTYRRGGGDNATSYATEAAGTSVYFKTYTFVAPTTGAMTFSIIEANLNGQDSDDTYMTLYQTSFNPASPATNFLRGDDDSGLGLMSSLTHSLVQGTTYVIVVSTYQNFVTGTFKLQLSTPIFPGTNSWFKDASGGTPIATGELFNPVGLAGSGIPNTATAGTTTFYVTNNLYASCRTPVTFTINPTPNISASLVSNPNLCDANSGAIAFNAPNLSNGTYSLNYTGVGSPKNVTVSNNTFALEGLSVGTYSNFSVNLSGCVGQDASSKTLVVDSLLPKSTTTRVIICSKSVASLVTNCSSNTPKWYDAAGTTLKGTGSPFVTESLTNNTSFKVRCESATCQSAFVDVLVTVNSASPIPIIQKDTLLLLGDTLTLKATGCTGTGLALKWYQVADDISVNMPISPIASSQYYAVCEKNQNALVCPSLKSNVLNVALTSVVKSVASGDWETESTWDISRIPRVGISVIIQPNHTVIVNGIGTAKTIQYNGTGTLKFNNASSKLNIGL